jgi:hypothetical protein
MSFILRSHHDRYRQRNRESFYRGITVAAGLILAMWLGYYIGTKRDAQDARQIELQNQDLQEQTTQNEQAKTELEARYQTLLIRYQQLAEKFKRELPQGDASTLSKLIQEQLERGMNPKRLEQVIRSTEPPQNCTEAVSKRFILSTPIYKGPQSAVTFADGAITVSGTGEPSINSKRHKEAWFDPGKPIQMIFTVIGGKKEEKQGLLPLTHTIVVQNREYRFTVSEGPRSFVVVTSDNCDYQESTMQLAPREVSSPLLAPIDASVTHSSASNASQ